MYRSSIILNRVFLCVLSLCLSHILCIYKLSIKPAYFLCSVSYCFRTLFIFNPSMTCLAASALACAISSSMLRILDRAFSSSSVVANNRSPCALSSISIWHTTPATCSPIHRSHCLFVVPVLVFGEAFVLPGSPLSIVDYNNNSCSCCACCPGEFGNSITGSWTTDIVASCRTSNSFIGTG